MHSYNKNTKTRRRVGSAQKQEKLRNILETLGGDEKAKPHSTKKGRISSGIRKLGRRIKAK